MLGDADCAHQALHLYHGGQGQEGKLRLKPYSPYSSDPRCLLHPSPPQLSGSSNHGYRTRHLPNGLARIRPEGCWSTE